MDDREIQEQFGRLWGEVRETKVIVRGADGRNGLMGRIAVVEGHVDDLRERQHTAYRDCPIAADVRRHIEEGDEDMEKVNMTIRELRGELLEAMAKRGKSAREWMGTLAPYAALLVMIVKDTLK